MLIKAEQKYARQTPTRLRLVATAVRKLSPADAMDQLSFMNKKAARALLSVFKQVMANATKNLGLSRDSLKIKEIIIGEGSQYKRFQPVSRGRAHSILKRTSHIRVVLESTEAAAAVKPKVQAQTLAAPKTEKEGEKLATLPKQMVVEKARMKQVAKSQTTIKTVSMRKTGER